MDPSGLAGAFDPTSTLAVLGFVGGGIALGTVSGLTPGVHANTFAFVLASVAASVPGPPRLIAAAMLAAGVTHTFLDVIPALALGVPDPAMAPAALPGHKLVLQGHGPEAFRLSALGSALAIAFAVPLAVPVTLGMQRAYPTIQRHMAVVLATVAVLLVALERTNARRAGAAATVVASGGLGHLALDLETGGLLAAGGTLMPLFAGLFGAPVLVEALAGDGVPPQEPPTVTTTWRFVAWVALVGTVAGALVGYLPGISSAIAATAALVAVPSRGPRGFVVATSGVDTANTVFALFALLALGSPRTGVLVAVEDAGVPIDVPLLLASVALAGAVAFVLVVAIGDRYLAAVGRVDNTHLSVGVLCFLVVLVGVVTGWIGVAIFCAGAVVGLIPGRFGAKRANCMGVLLLPLIAFYAG